MLFKVMANGIIRWDLESSTYKKTPKEALFKFNLAGVLRWTSLSKCFKFQVNNVVS